MASTYANKYEPAFIRHGGKKLNVEIFYCLKHGVSKLDVGT